MAAASAIYKRLNRAGPGIAGVRAAERRIWNGNWEARWDASSDAQTLTAMADDIRFTLRLSPAKPPVIQGENGVSVKGAGPGQGIALRFVPAARRGRHAQRRCRDRVRRGWTTNGSRTS